MLPGAPLLLAFVGASLVLALTPGPAVVYIVTRTVSQGRACGIASVLGIALGNLANALAAAFGLGALFAVSSAAFGIVKWAGAAYLVYLGARMWLAESAAVQRAPQVTFQPLSRVFRDAVVVAVLNPKTTLFFAALLPQFVEAGADALRQTLALGCTFVAVACVTDLLYVSCASAIAPRLRSAGRYAVWGNRIAGTSFIGLGVLAATGVRTTR